jgi:hypothetical protein
MTTTNATKADRFANRAPKGGAISLVNGLFYAGGQFMPMVAADKVWSLSKPVALAGSVRQVAWASRLRREALEILDDEIHVRRLFLAGAVKTQADASRKSIKPFLIARHNLTTERSAGSIIDRRAELA